MDKYQLIDSIAIQIDAMVDMRGVEKCKTALDVIGKLNALRGGLAEDDKRMEELKRRLEEMTPTEDDETEVIDGHVYKIGVTAE